MPGGVLNAPAAGLPPSGYFGKSPARRDFVTGGLSRAFTEPWHAWLEDGLIRSRELLGEDWLGAYLNQPVWRFALSAGLCGQSAVAGVMIPSASSRAALSGERSTPRKSRALSIMAGPHEKSPGDTAGAYLF